MTRIADASTIAPWPAWLWLTIAVVAVLFLLTAGLCRAAARTRPQPPALSQVTVPPAAVPAKTCPPALRVHHCAAGCGGYVGREGWVCGECIRQGWIA